MRCRTTKTNDCWDDEIGELPVDLSELGQQLQADARHLAHLYPPLAGDDPDLGPSADVAVRGTRWSKIVQAGSGTSLVVLLGVTVGMAIQGMRSETAPAEAAPDQGNTARVVNEDTKSATPNLLVVTAPKRSEQRYSEVAAPIELPNYVVPYIDPLTPVSAEDPLILNAGGPQAEAYLDYIEMTSVHSVKLSL